MLIPGKNIYNADMVSNNIFSLINVTYAQNNILLALTKENAKNITLLVFKN